MQVRQGGVVARYAGCEVDEVDVREGGEGWGGGEGVDAGAGRVGVCGYGCVGVEGEASGGDVLVEELGVAGSYAAAAAGRFD